MKLWISISLSILAMAAPAFAQATATEPASTRPAGLDALDEDRLYGELANRGLEKLLERAFELDNVPQDKREGIRTLLALRELANPDSKLSPQQRLAAVQRVVKGIEQALPAMTDPKLLMQQATTLIRYGVERDVNTLEYWGANPRTQATLRPIADTVARILDKATAEARRQSDALANQIQSLNDPKIAQAEQLINLATSAEYTKYMADYYRVLAMDDADPKRAEIAARAVQYLQTFDNPDSQVQPIVRNRMAKMLMLTGEYDQARQLFASVASGDDIQPKPTPQQQYEARYFSAVCELLAGKADAARSKLDELLTWQKDALPQDKATQEGAGAASAMLEYRIHLLEAQVATDPAAKKQATDAAIATLLALVKQRPELQGIIFDQLAGQLPATGAVDVHGLDTLLLQALIRKGEEERLKPEGEEFDRGVVERAIAAARETLQRQASASADPAKQVDPQFAETASLLIPFFLEKLDRKADAAMAFLDYIQHYPSNRKNGEMALDNALAMIAQLRKSAPDDPATMRAYERFLPVAINPPFGRKIFAYEWARRLQSLGRYKEAAEVFRQVPEDDPRKLQARFYEMVALQQRLDYEKMDAAVKRQVVQQIQQLADQVRSDASKALASASTDQDKLTDRSLLARTTLLSADIARREQDNPQRALELLKDFEQSARGLPNEQDLLSSVLFSRVQAYMQLGRNSEATDALVALLKTKEGGEGAAIVYNLLEKLNADLDRARAAGDTEQLRILATNRATLSGFLVDWARNNPDPKISRFTYRYSVFDAATKQLAAELEPDPQQRTEALKQTLALYQSLLNADNAALYRQTIEPGSNVDSNYPDPQVMLGIGLVQYELGNYAEAQKTLGKLLTDRKLGSPVTFSEADGQTRRIDNDRYWEATLKLLKSNVHLAQSDPAQQAAMKQSQDYLKQLYIRWGAQVGGAKWAKEFQQLRKEIIPDFAVPGLGESPATAPAGQAQ